jgi:hypothetical protein
MLETFALTLVTLAAALYLQARISARAIRKTQPQHKTRAARPEAR